MWDIEVNIAGYRFMRRVPTPLRIIRLSPRSVHWRPAMLRHPHAA
jgi:hypothetical protein